MQPTQFDRSLSPAEFLLAQQALVAAEPAVQTVAPAQPVFVAAQPVYLHMPYVGSGSLVARFFACLVDDLICGAIVVAAYLVAVCVSGALLALGAAADSPSGVFAGVAAIGLAIPLAAFCCFAYAVSFETGPSQATLGKQLFGLKIVTTTGHRITATQSIGRLLVKSILSPLLFGAGFWIALFTDRKQSLHDIAASTVVVRSR